MRMFTVFYAGEVHDEFDSFSDNFKAETLKLFRTACDQEIYNGAYVHLRTTKQWYRVDGTPVLLSDVPKRLRVLVLLLS